MNIITINDPVRMIIKAASNIFPDVSALIQYDPSLEDKGTAWLVSGDTNGNTLISLDPSISVMVVAGALAEAITSCYVGTNVDTDSEEYKDALDQLVNEYDRINNSSEQELNNEYAVVN